MKKPDAKIIAWLMESDPSIRWQVQRDLLGAKSAVYEKERAKVSTEGWGAKLLAKQDKKGTWAGGIYTPKFTSTHYTLLALRRFGLPPGNAQALKACKLLMDSSLLTNVGKDFPKADDGHPDMCVMGMILSIVCYFNLKDERIHELAAFLFKHQMQDLGWNCRSWRGDKHASFHTTCSVLEGLLEYQNAYPKTALPVAKAQAGGREFLLQHHLYKSDRTGKIVKEAMLRFPFPPQWHYDFVKALDVFQAADAARDKRAEDAIELLLSKRDADGRWPQFRGPAGKYFFSIESPDKSGRGNTLRALRILQWWEAK